MHLLSDFHFALGMASTLFNALPSVIRFSLSITVIYLAFVTSGVALFARFSDRVCSRSP